MPKRTISHSLIMAPFFALSLFCASPGYATTDKFELASDVPAPTIIFPNTSLGLDELVVVVNDIDSPGAKIAKYRNKRNIPNRNMIHVSFVPGPIELAHAEFGRSRSMV